MNDTFLFIIWNRALFCKNEILNDLRNSFLIKKEVFIEWNADKFQENLNKLYGNKCTNYNEKAFLIGKGKFLVVVVEDDKPKFEERLQQNKLVKVNANVYDKKWLYRKWTAGNFRIHASVTQEETEHDLSVLLGSNYMETLNSIKDGEILKIDAYEPIVTDDCIYNTKKEDIFKTIKNEIKYLYLKLTYKEK